MRGIHKLTSQQIKRAPAGRHSDGGGLYLYIDDKGGRRWVWRYRRGSREAGKLTELGLGSARDVTLADARDLAGQMRAAVARGEDPRATRSRANAPTFQAIADQYIETMTPRWRNAKHAKQWASTIARHCRPILSRPVDQISATDVVAVLKPIWHRLPETAGRVRGRIELILDAAAAAGHRDGENPARWKGKLKHLLPERRTLSRGHFEAVAYHSLHETIAALRKLNSVSALALEFVILTAARSGEARGMTWAEVDGDVWTVPAERMKPGRVHRVPLTDRCLEILERMRTVRTGKLVFPGARRGRPLSDMALTMCLRGIKPGYTVHGFRSTFRDWAGDCTSHPREIVEAALSHVIGDKAEQAYRRGDALERRRALMEDWSRFVMATGDNVVRLRG